MAKKVEYYCYSCDADYVLHYDENVCKNLPEFCAFCGNPVEEDDADIIEE